MFGRHLLADFDLEEGFVSLNHGSFGTRPKVVRDAVYKWHAKIEARPDQFMKIDFSTELYKVRQRLAKLVNVDPDEIAPVQNATTGVNAVLRSLVFQPGEGILHFSTIYGSCGNTAEWVSDHSEGRVFTREVHVTYPASPESIISSFEAALQEGAIKVAIFDLIVSLPGIKMPWVELVALCRKYNVLSLVDGAHSIGAVHLDLHAADPDFFVTNCHKWLHCMRAVAILYVPFRNQHLVHSLPTGHGYIPRKRSAAVSAASAKSQFTTEFEFSGTVDFAPFLVITDALKYRESIGGEDAIIAYCTNLATEGGQVVARILQTEVLSNYEAICMTNIRLP